MVVQLYYNSQLPVVFGILAPLVVYSRCVRLGLALLLLLPLPLLPYAAAAAAAAGRAPPGSPRPLLMPAPRPCSLRLWNFWVGLDLIFGAVQALAFLCLMTWRCMHRHHPLDEL